MSTLAIITARGGSKRVPRKNIKSFMGKPMLSYPIEAALNSGIFDEVMVSTDDAEIADVARKYGAKVPFLRSERTSNDKANTCDVLEEVIAQYKERAQEFDIACCLYPCSPFLTAATLQNAYRQMKEAGTDSLIPVCKYPVPVEWAMKIEGGLLRAFDLAAHNTHSQNLVPKYHDAGTFYFFKPVALLKYKNLVTENTSAFILPESEVQDIDNEEDWKMAEIKFRILNHV